MTEETNNPDDPETTTDDLIPYVSGRREIVRARFLAVERNGYGFMRDDARRQRRKHVRTSRDVRRRPLPC